MRLRNEAKVGLIVVGALALLIGIYWFLGGFSLRASSFPAYTIFPNAQKLDKGADVRMAGVKIGIVSDVVLTKSSKARINMLIWKGVCIPSDSKARVTTGAFVGDFYVEVLPGKANNCILKGQRIESEQIAQFDQLMNKANDLLTELKTTAKGINKVLDNKKMQEDINQTIASIKKSAQSASMLILSAQNLIAQASPEVQKTLANLSAASEHAVDISQQMEECLAKDIRPNVKPLIGQAQKAMVDMSSALNEAQSLLSSLGELTPEMKQILAKANGSAQQAEQMLTNLNAASASIKNLTTDPELICNLKATAKNIAEASCKANLAMDKINQKLGAFKGPTQQQKSEIPLYGISGDGLWNTAKGKYRFDANYTFALGYPMFMRAGLYNVGENTRVNFQAGNTFDESNALRYGLYASRVGIGYDHRFGKKVLISTDIFRPDDPQIEMRGIFGIKDGLGLYTGVQDLLDEDNRDLLVGINYNN
ncbi:MlaD family protein [bacterium]|nr:MlaD family protein [bacterium]